MQLIRKGPEQLCELLRRGGRRLPARIGWTCAGRTPNRIAAGFTRRRFAGVCTRLPPPETQSARFRGQAFPGGNRFGRFQGTAALKTKPPRPFQETRLRPKGQKKEA